METIFDESSGVYSSMIRKLLYLLNPLLFICWYPLIEKDKKKEFLYFSDFSDIYNGFINVNSRASGNIICRANIEF